MIYTPFETLHLLLSLQEIYYSAVSFSFSDGFLFIYISELHSYTHQ